MFPFLSGIYFLGYDEEDKKIFFSTQTCQLGCYEYFGFFIPFISHPKPLKAYAST